LFLTATLLLGGCTRFDPGLIDPAAPPEAADRHLVGVWQTGEGKKATFLDITMETPTLLRVRAVNKGRCDQVASFSARLVTVAERRYVDLRRDGDKDEILGAYEWKDENQFDVWGTDDEVFAKEVEQGQMLGTVQRSDKSLRVEILASQAVLRDFLKKHPGAMKLLATLRRSSDFPC
jgi:hypothetical protein